MKTVSAGVGILAISLLLSLPAYAKKDKGEAYQIQPTITAEQAKAAVTAALPQLSLGKPFSSPSLPQSEKLIIYIKYIRHLRQNYGHYILSGLESFGF